MMKASMYSTRESSGWGLCHCASCSYLLHVAPTNALDGLDHLQVTLDGGGYSCHELAIYLCTSPASCALVVFVLYQIHFTNVFTYKIANVVICYVSVCVCVCVHLH